MQLTILLEYFIPSYIFYQEQKVIVNNGFFDSLVMVIQVFKSTELQLLCFNFYILWK